MDEECVVLALSDLFGPNDEAQNIVGRCPYQVAEEWHHEIIVQGVPRQERLVTWMLSKGSFLLGQISLVILSYLSDIPHAD